MSYICYTVNSWKYDNFLNRKFDETFNCWWEHIEKDAYCKAQKECKSLQQEREAFADGMLDMNIILKKKTYKDFESVAWSVAFPDAEEILFDTRSI